MTMPLNVQYMFTARDDQGRLIKAEEGFTDDFSASLESFYQKVLKEKGDRYFARITADMALDLRSRRLI